SPAERSDQSIDKPLVVDLLEPMDVPEGEGIYALAPWPLSARDLVRVGDPHRRGVRLHLKISRDAVVPALQLGTVLIEPHQRGAIAGDDAESVVPSKAHEAQRVHRGLDVPLH